MPVSREMDSNGSFAGPCVSLNARNVLEDEVPNTTAIGALIFRCLELNNSQFVFKAGTINTENLETACEDIPLFSISAEEEEDRAFLPLGDKQSFCMDGNCVFFEAMNQTVLLSAFILEDEVETIRAEEIEVPFLITEVLYEFDGLLEAFGKALLDAFTSNINDPLVLRTQVFLGSAETNCSFI
ncbi:hypothetical protein FGB62_126g03 [Gracilaria domingensis]|nr:hypothetical protein FGB62_126g03 [Gracilaria domingensis]